VTYWPATGAANCVKVTVNVDVAALEDASVDVHVTVVTSPDADAVNVSSGSGEHTVVAPVSVVAASTTHSSKSSVILGST